MSALSRVLAIMCFATGVGLMFFDKHCEAAAMFGMACYNMILARYIDSRVGGSR